MTPQPSPEGIEVLAPTSEQFSEILTPEALRFLRVLHKGLSDMRKMLLQKREERQKQLDSGVLPSFPATTTCSRR